LQEKKPAKALFSGILKHFQVNPVAGKKFNSGAMSGQEKGGNWTILRGNFSNQAAFKTMPGSS